MNAIPKKRGRPSTSPLTRAEQLRQAKRAQRRRERRAGLSTVELRLPEELADRLRIASRATGFEAALNEFLDAQLVDLERWPALRELAWNRADRWILARDALALYERNWRFVDTLRLEPDERKLIDRLKQEFGGGMLHA